MSDDFGNDAATAAALAVGATVNGRLETPDDIDVFRFTAPDDVGELFLEFRITAAFDTESFEDSFQVTAIDGRVITPTYFSGAPFDLTYDTDVDEHTTKGSFRYAPFEGSEVLLKVQTPGTSAGAATYSIELTTFADDHGDTQATASVLTPGTPAEGLIGGFLDNDVFRIAATPGNRVTLLLEGDDDFDTPDLTYPFLSLSGPGIRFSQGGFAGPGYDVQHSFTMPETGEVYADVFASAGGLGYYRLSASETEILDDYANSPETTGRVEVGGSVTGALEIPNDKDWFRVTLEAAKNYAVAVDTLTADNLYAAFGFVLLDPTGTSTVDYRGDGRGARATDGAVISVGTGGDYLLSVADSIYSYDETTGTYSLSVSEVTDDIGATPDTAATLAVGGSAAGVINHGFLDPIGRDQDWFRVTLEAGTIYHFELDAPDGAPPPATLIDIRNAEGRIVFSPYTRQDGRELSFLATEDADYFVVASGGTAPFDQILAEPAPYTVTADALYDTGFEAADLTASRTYQHGFLAGKLFPDNDLFVGSSSVRFVDLEPGSAVLLGDDGPDHLSTAGAQPELAASTAIVVRAFQLLLGRTPKDEGLGFFPDLIAYREDPEAGQRMAQFILESEEFKNAHAGISDADFVDLLYTGLRGPDAAVSDAERDSAMEMVDQVGRAKTAQFFLNSPEMRQATEGRVLDLLYRNTGETAQDDVYTAYRALLGRDPDRGGFDKWLAAMDDGLPLSALVQRIMGSAEFQAQGALDDRAFAAVVLTNIGGAAPDSGALDSAAALLGAGVARADFAAAQILLTPVQARDWIVAQGTDDILIGGSGMNTMIGGDFSDRFVFLPGDTGLTRIVDFEPWDHIEMAGFGFADGAEALAAFRQEGNAVVFAQDGLAIILRDTDLSVLTEDTFLV